MPNYNMSALVWAADIAPPIRKLVALRLAELHDRNQGGISISMGALAAQAGASVNSVRSHVHGLQADGVLAVIANASGGAPGAPPRYRLNEDRLRALAVTPAVLDLFSEDMLLSYPEKYRASGAFRFCSTAGIEMKAELVGLPGRRAVKFTRIKQGVLPRQPYGTVRLSLLMCDRRAGAWSGHLTPEGPQTEAHDYDYVILAWDVMDQLAQWAQNEALGRVESMATV
jgi:hypothetical protein